MEGVQFRAAARTTPEPIAGDERQTDNEAGHVGVPSCVARLGVVFLSKLREFFGIR
jgi:hypothetical protein